MNQHPPLRLRRPPRPLWVWALVFAPVVALSLWLVFWLVDSSGSASRTPRGLRLENPVVPEINIDIGRLSKEQLTAVVVDLAEQFQQTPVEIATPSQSITVAAEEIGLAVDVDATVDAVMEQRSGTGNPFEWTASFFERSKTDLLFTLSADASRIAQMEIRLQSTPTEPAIVLENGVFQVADGIPGQTARLASALPGLLASATRGENPLRVEAEVRLNPPDMEEEAMAHTADRINRLTSQGLLTTVEGITRRVQPAQLRTWLTLQPGDGQWSYGVDQAKIDEDLAELFAEVATVASEPVLTVIDDIPVLVTEVPSLVCCQDNAYRIILRALDDTKPAVELELRESNKINDQTWLAERGLVELTGRFTTYHTPGQDRVSNIHRIAEIVQGAVVYPGETFSVNDYVGERTEEKGFVDAGVIYDGVYDSDVGGGISQFITTLFTAAFNAGMEFPEYQAHSIDIARYREGVDATISWPKPDFKFRNPNPYAVLLWPTVTDTSVTVSIYSTAYAEVEWADRYDTPRGFCTLRTTERTRAYDDGTVLRDSVSALYQPREGISCAGACTPSVLPFDADGDGEAELDEEGLPRRCVPPEECTDTHAPADVDEDQRADLCTIAPAAPEPLSEQTATSEPSSAPGTAPESAPGTAPESAPGTAPAPGAAASQGQSRGSDTAQAPDGTGLSGADQ